LRIGDQVTYDGHTYVLVGFEPMSLPMRRAELEDVRTGRRTHVRVADLEQSTLPWGRPRPAGR
jgi:hypothetical protein